MATSRFCGPELRTLSIFRPEVSILKIIQEALRHNGDHVLMIEGDTSERVTSAQLLEKITTIAAELQHAGVSPGDVVVLCCEKSILACSLFLGSMLTGATVVLAPPPYADTIDKLTSGVVVKALFYNSIFGEAVSQSLARMTPTPSLVGKTVIDDPVINSLLTSTRGFREYQVEDVTKHIPIVYFTSGTTGNPKGIEISDIAAQLAGVLFRHTIKSLLHGTPLYWYSALCFILGSIIKNYTLILTNSKDATYRLKLIEKYKIHSFFCNNASMIQHNSEKVPDDISLSSVENILMGGETVLPSVARPFFTEVMKNQAHLVTLYGSTEAGIICDHNVPDIGSMKVGPCGKPSPGVEIKILDDQGNPVALGVTGRVWVKSQAMKGYWRRDDLNRSFVDGEGFYCTGDAGYFDGEGYLYVLGRICDLIDFRGTKVSPAFLEDLLMDHPAVKDAVVIGKAHPSDIQHPTAYVVLRQNYQGKVSESDIRTYVDEQVEDTMRLRGGVHFRDSLPRVSNGKVIRTYV